MINKNELKFNFSKTKKISVFKDVGNGIKSILLTNNNKDIELPKNTILPDFFDLIITSNLDQFYTHRVDVFIDKSDSPYKNSILNLSIFDIKDALFVLNKNYMSVLKKAKLDLDNYIVCSDDMIEDDIVELFGFNNLFTNKKQIEEMISQKTKYGTLKNIISKNRKKFVV